jgi:hypothetical protein
MDDSDNDDDGNTSNHDGISHIKESYPGKMKVIPLFV